ncbi:CU044_2847 family protein [Streptomyces genisteinicus]|uniref:Trypsin-co-occurring domain-containing protein n=1 Tax=Streptomyces genisteinicus TaxID=2768068 RepID=A0A7H0I1T3_9ACTN|nr:CU044_2847 family protein [Streptomyces genisteinicus]QNP66749.1 hypothetical protein IAG43_30055 [Streptomyces genisteinicus]
MPEYLELDLGGAALRVELAAVGEPATIPSPAAPADDAAAADLPEGFGDVTPVARGRRPAEVAHDVLRSALSPLGPLLEEVHAAVTATPHPPQELTVEFGVQIGKDLKLGIVGVNGQATMTVSATWQNQAPGGA